MPVRTADVGPAAGSWSAGGLVQDIEPSEERQPGKEWSTAGSRGSVVLGRSRHPPGADTPRRRRDVGQARPRRRRPAPPRRGWVRGRRLSP